MHGAVIIGTRPEAIKLGPVVRELVDRGIATTVIHTGQHSDLVADPFELFGVAPDVALDTMRPSQTLPGLASRLTEGLVTTLRDIHAINTIDVAVVQGDTASTVLASLASVHAAIPVVHVEAGLRTGKVSDPFPEEVNRTITSLVADHHFAPTDRAVANLTAEGITADAITLTGNTVVDAVRFVLERHGDQLAADREEMGLAGARYIAMTVHRRESWGDPMREIMRGVKDVIDADPTLSVVFPVHPNPFVRDVADEILSSTPNVRLIEPTGYRAFIAMLQGAETIVTDSGGIQEEAPTLGKHTLVVRNTTERSEGIDAGTSTLVGTNRNAVSKAITALLSAPGVDPAENPFGDGHASARIVDVLVERYAPR